MSWWYKLQDTDNRLMEVRYDFRTEQEALEVGDRARRTIQDISPGKTLTVTTGDDERERTQKLNLSDFTSLFLPV